MAGGKKAVPVVVVDEVEFARLVLLGLAEIIELLQTQQHGPYGGRSLVTNQLRIEAASLERP